MAEKANDSARASASVVDVGKNRTTLLSMGEDDDNILSRPKNEGGSVEAGSSEVALEDDEATVLGDGEDEEGEEGEGGEGEDAPEGTGDDNDGVRDESGEQDDAVLDLGEFDPADPAKFDTAYQRDDGTLNIGRLSQEWWANAGKQGAETGSLNEGTYDYLKATFGLAKSNVKDIEAAIKLQTDSQRRTIMEAAGGEAAVNAAIEWGKKGGYTAAQRAQFNKVMNSGDQAAIADALEAVVSRHQKATGGVTRRQQMARAEAAKPKKDATTGGAGTPAAEEGFKDMDEYNTALREARKQHVGKKREDAVQAATAKLSQSAFYKAQRAGKPKRK